MTVTTDGRIVAAAGSGDKGRRLHLLTPEGKVVATIPTPESPTNVEFGGADRKTLYVTAGKSLYRIQTTLTGFHVWPRSE